MKLKDQLAPVGEDWQINIAIEEIKEKRRENNDKRRFQIAISVMAGIAAGASAPMGSIWGISRPCRGSGQRRVRSLAPS
jgi:hypothetical protein